jgi:hypothetical protein
MVWPCRMSTLVAGARSSRCDDGSIAPATVGSASSWKSPGEQDGGPQCHW